MGFVEATGDIKTLSTCSLILFIKIFITLWIQNSKSTAAGARPPEDTNSNKAGFPEQTYGALLEVSESPEGVKQARALDYRWRRIVQNDMETIPIALLVFIASMLASGVKWLNVVLIIIFTVVRLGHTFAYAHQKSSPRVFFWMVGQIVVLISAINGFFSFM